MSFTLENAFAELADLTGDGRVPTLLELQTLAAKISHDVPNATYTLLYSGSLLGKGVFAMAKRIADAAGGSIRIINDTDIANFLMDSRFHTALSDAIGAGTGTFEFDQALNGPYGFFGDASMRFVREASGPIKTLSASALFIRSDGTLPVFAHRELVAALDNLSITTIDGIDRTLLKGTYTQGIIQGLSHVDALENVFSIVRLKSLVDLIVTEFRIDANGEVKVPQAWFELGGIHAIGDLTSLNFDSGALFSKTFLGIIALPDFVDMHGTGIKLLKGLGVLGTAGDVIEGLFAATQAYEQWQAGDTNAAIDTIGEFLGGVAGSALFLAPFAPLLIPLFLTGGPAVAVLAVAGLVGLGILGDMFGKAIYHDYVSPILHLINDPLVLDLDGDGIELSALAGSNVHFDYDGDGFAERTGWVSADDGILVIDRNGNGTVDGGAELFGSATQDGFAVLETFDSNGDGKIDASDAAFGQLRVWRDLDQDGISDAGELQTLTEAGVASISLTRNDAAGTNAGHTVGYQGLFTRADGSTGNAQTIYFQTDRQNTRIDNTPNFTPAAGVDKLPGLAGSGTINSIAYKLTNDPAFRTAWTALSDNAGNLTPEQLRGQFEALLLKWAGVESVNSQSRGEFVDARHLAFVEAFFGDGYREIQWGQEVRTYPSSATTGLMIEASFQQIVSVLESAFLAQTAFSSIARGGDLAAAFDSPYFFFALLDFGGAPSGQGPATPGNIGLVTKLIVEAMPEGKGAAAAYLSKAFIGLDGMATVAFEGNRTAYAAAIAANLATITDPVLHKITAAIVDGTARAGLPGPDALSGTTGDDVFIGGADDFIDGRSGSDITVYSKANGDLWIRDEAASSLDRDQLVLTDLNAADIGLVRSGYHLLINVTSTGKTIVVDNFFQKFETESRGIETVRFADGTEWGRVKLQAEAVFQAASLTGSISDSTLDDVIMASRGDNYISYSGGNDTIIYRKGDGSDVLVEASSASGQRDVLHLSDLDSSDVVFSRVGNNLVIAVKETGEYISDVDFFAGAAGVRGLELVKFANGEAWDRARIVKEAWFRGDDNRDSIGGTAGNDILTGGKGDDSLAGGEGSDTYVWAKGDGSDSIVENSEIAGEVDKLVFKDVKASDVRLSYQGDTLLITIVPTGEVVEVDKQLFDSDNLMTDWGLPRWGVEQIQFANGETWDRQEIAHKAGEQYLGRDYEWFTMIISVNGASSYVYDYFVDEFGNKGDAHGADYGLNDIFYGNAGMTPTVDHPDELTGNAGHNYMNGFYGNDTLVGGGADDILIGDKGNDILYGDHGMFSVDGNDVLEGNEGDDQLYGGGGTDRLSGATGNDVLHGEDGKDYLDGGFGDDVFRGGKGDDVLTSADGNDTFIYSNGDGDDLIDENSLSGSETDTLVFTNLNASDVTFSRSGVDAIIRVNSTGEQIVLDQQFHTNFQLGLEVIRFADGTEWGRTRVQQESWFRGTEGRDSLLTSALDDVIDAGKGDDRIDSGGGSDTIIYSAGDGNDWIDENSLSSSETDTLVFTNLNASDVTFSRFGVDAIIRVNSTGEQIVLDQQFHNYSQLGLEVIRFADGTEWGRSRIQQEAWFRGTDGRDGILTSALDDVIDAGKGDDLIDSREGSDTFIYSAGDGNDRIDENGYSSAETDILAFTDINAPDVTFSRTGVDLTIRINSTGEQIVLDQQFHSSSGLGLEGIRFANGTEWDRDALQAAATSGSAFFAGGNGDDVIIGSALSQNLFGNRGNDRIDGLGGSDLQYGGVGNDTLVISESTAGDVDTLNGGAGNDTVEFADFASAVWVDLVTNGKEARTRDGVDLLSGLWRDIADIEQAENIIGTSFDDALAGDASDNVLNGGAGKDVLDGRSGNDTLIGAAGNDQLDGYVGDDVLDGGTGDDILVGGLGNDSLKGGSGGDTYHYSSGGGRDTIVDAADPADGTDTLQLSDLNLSDVSLWRAGEDLWVKVTATGEIVTIEQQFDTQANSGIELVRFANGDVLDRSALAAQASLYIPLAAEDDGGFTTSEDTAITISPAALLANDAGMSGLEIVSVAHAVGGHVSQLPSGDLRFTPATNFHGIASFTYTITDSWGGSISGTVEIDVTPVNDAPTLVQALPDQQSLAGQSVAFTLPADAFSDVEGSALTYSSSLSDGAPLPAWLTFDPVSRAFFGTPPAGFSGTLQLKVSASDGSLATSDIFALRIIGNEIEVTHRGTAGADNLSGSSGDDVISGMAGDDILAGGAGNDTYIYARGDGNDTINEVLIGSPADKLVLQGINPAAVSLIRNGNNATLVIAESAQGAGDGGSILLNNQLDSQYDYGVEQIVFADGTIWTQLDMRLMVLAQASTSGNDTITGFVIDDTITGGLGNDTLNGVDGNDTYIYARGDGNDTINEVLAGSPTDKLVLQGIAPAAVSLIRNGNNVTLVIAESAQGVGDGGSILLNNQLDSQYDYGVEQIVFANGTIWTQLDLRLMVLAQASTSGNDTITGFVIDDTITGGLGNDTLNGGDGNDTYIYARGDGNDTINEVTFGSPTDKLTLQGINPAAVSLIRNGNNVTLVIAETVQGAGDGGSILLNSQLDSQYDSGVEQIVFADGTIWTQLDLRLMVLAQAPTSGDDTIVGFLTDDTITGGAGNDTLNGGDGNDTYVYALGNGRDVILDTAGTDKIQLNGIAPSNVTVVRNGDNIILLIGQDGGRITIRNQLVAANRIESVLFDNGTTWTYQNLETLAIANDGSIITHFGTSNADSLTGTSDLDVFNAGLGNDTLSGVAGSDVYIYESGDGNDTINDNSSSTTNIDTLKLTNLNASDVILSREGVHLKIRVIATNEVITVQNHFNSATQNWGIEKIIFADATNWDLTTINANAWIRGGSGDDTLTGTSGADTLEGNGGNDTLNGAAGADVMYGGTGNDTYVVDNAGDVVSENAGDGTDTVQASVSYTLQTNVEHLVLTGNAPNGTGNAGANSITGTIGNNILAGLGGADSLNGGSGTDTATYAASSAGVVVNLFSGTGSGGDAAGDTLTSIENLIGSDFDDFFEGSSGTNALDGGAGTDTVSYEHATSAVAVNLATTTLQSTGGAGLDTLSGFENLIGSQFNDTLTGTAGANRLTGLGGNDSLSGQAGSDTFMFASGFGKDTIQDFTAGAASDDIIEFDDDAFANFAAVMAAATQVGADTVITLDANNTLTLKSVTMTNLHADDFSFMTA